MKMLNFPESRQTFNYDCGARAMLSVLSYYGIDVNESKILKIAKTNPKGTPVHGMIKVAKHFNFKAKKERLTIERIKRYIDKKTPIITILQAWAKRKVDDWENDWTDGHYVVAIGYDNKKIYFEDPSSILRTYLEYEELKKRWHDIDDKTKKRYYNFGIVIHTKKKPANLKKVVHMD